MKRYQQYHQDKAVHPVHYEKGLEDINPTPAVGDHTYVAKFCRGEKSSSTSNIIKRPQRPRKETLNAQK